MKAKSRGDSAESKAGMNTDRKTLKQVAVADRNECDDRSWLSDVLIVSSNDSISFYYYEGVFTLDIDWGNNTVEISTDVYTESVSLQQWHTVLCSWDSDNDFFTMILDGKSIGTGINPTAPTSSEPVTCNIPTSGGD